MTCIVLSKNDLELRKSVVNNNYLRIFVDMASFLQCVFASKGWCICTFAITFNKLIMGNEVDSKYVILA